MSQIDEILSRILPADRDAMKAAAERWDVLVKPPGSLGRLEELAVRLAGATANPAPEIEGKISLIYAADHGVVAEGVSVAPRETTALMVGIFARGRGGINALAARAGSHLRVVDVGVATPYDPPEGVVVRRIREGTGNLRIEAAMSAAEADAAITAGVETCREFIDETGANLVGIGEMGIGNTTPAAAITACLTGKNPEVVVGPGAGLDVQGVGAKARVVADALELHKPDRRKPREVLAKVGGLEIGAMAGAMLEAAARRCLVVVDGYISAAAALLANAMNPTVREYLVLGHLSAEPGHRAAAAALELRPVLDLGLRLGEGTGAALAMTIIEAARDALAGMSTLAEAGIVLPTTP